MNVSNHAVSLVGKMKQRQRELLNRYLPNAALREYFSLEDAIAMVSHFMEERTSKQPKKSSNTPKAKRVQKKSTREKMIEFLKKNGPSSPMQMRIALRLPKDSGKIHTALNQGKNRYFLRLSDALWTVKEANPIEQPSKPTKVSAEKIVTGIAARRVNMDTNPRRNSHAK